MHKNTLGSKWLYMLEFDMVYNEKSMELVPITMEPKQCLFTDKNIDIIMRNNRQTKIYKLM